ncbi:MAG: 30S ribosomal protein S18 [Candidatus Moranbacteria bacterium]|nr:30S ribosomal protein S18 [Candidatus Moranbacteria bacterium]
MINSKDKNCYLCENDMDKLDYKDTNLLQKFITPQGKIRPPRKTFLCSKHQRLVAKTVKRARVIALLPYVRT